MYGFRSRHELCFIRCIHAQCEEHKTHLIHCSVKNFQAIQHVLSSTAFCLRIYRAKAEIRQFSNLLCGETNFILRIKEQETRLTLQEHDDDDDDNFL